MKTVAPPAQTASPASPSATIPRYRGLTIFAIWAAAALPMAALAWLVAPVLADSFVGVGNIPMAKALIVSLGVGVIWQFVLVVALVAREQRSLRWSTLRDVLWLHSPRSPRSGRIGGRVWLVLIPLIVAFAAAPFVIPALPSPDNRDFGKFLESQAGQGFMSGNWAWFGLLLAMLIFNSALGEELLFRGFLLPRMNGAFGRADWVVNGILFAAYHLHMPWAIPTNLLDTFIVSYPVKRYRSAWIGIVVHSSQSAFFSVIVLRLVV